MMRIYNAKVFDPDGGFAGGEVIISGDRFAQADEGGGRMDAGGCYAIPGLVDIHLHGCAGHDFSDADAAGIDAMAAYQAANGVTAILPTTMTLPEDALAAACVRIAQAGSQAGAQIAGIHLEGPFVSPNRLGAQNPDHVRRPDAALVRRLQDAAGGLVRLLALAPEMEGALGVIAALRGEITCSIAHTEADYEAARAALEAGANHVTHLYNAMPPLLHREPGVIGAAAERADCYAEIICDGVHIHPGAVRAALKLFGEEHLVFVSDSMMATGMGDGDFELGGLPVRVSGREARLAQGGALAGSVTNLMGCLRTAVREVGLSLHTAVKCASTNPAKSVGLFAERGSIAPGKYADLVLLDEALEIRQVFLRGKPLPAHGWI